MEVNIKDIEIKNLKKRLLKRDKVCKRLHNRIREQNFEIEELTEELKLLKK